MALAVYFNYQWYFPKTDADAVNVITQVFAGLDHEHVIEGQWEDGSPHSVYFPGSDAWFSIGARGSGESESFDGKSHLRVGANRKTGYGALCWLVNEGHRQAGSVAGGAWVSDNPHPLSEDPRVICDPSIPTFHDPRGAFPIIQVRAAVEEFCRTGTGDRPAAVSWVMGDMAGRRKDTPVQPAATKLDDPWA